MLETSFLSKEFESFFIPNIIRSAIFLVVILFIFFLVMRWLRKAHFNWTTEQRLRMINNVQGIFVTLIFIGLLYIWAEELRTLIFSIVGVALAIVVATKELLMCFSGSTLRLRSNSYEVGDRIEFMGIRGDVIATNFVSTSILEAGIGQQSPSQTGRIITFPNSLLLNNVVINESLLSGFFTEQIKIPLHRDDDWEKMKDVLQNIAQEECYPFLKEAQAQAARFQRKEGIECPSVYPVVTISFSDKEWDSLYLVLRFLSPMSLKGKVQQAILQRFLKQARGTDQATSG
ncbi:MAG: mscS mechanosensitive ion channel [Chlamydiales bacterium]|jgi:small-conductance mechanosensitive channel|nr:mscS mechanosensitive ion channel [Chlamydiales bacterium]